MPSQLPVRRRSRVRAATTLVLVLQIPLAIALLAGRLAAPAQALAAGEHAYLAESADGQPITWDPCSPIGYVVNWDHAPAGALQLWTDAVATVEEATGLTFTSLGSTRVSPRTGTPAGTLPAGAEVLVAWVPTAEEPRFASGEAIGLAGPQTYGGGGRVYTSGRIWLDADWFAGATPAEARGVVLHELGHLVGLAHVDDPTQLMDEGGSLGREYQQGDLDGLAHLGPLAGPRCS